MGAYPALAVQPPPDPTQGLERAVTLRNLLQNAPLELQQRQQAVQLGQGQIQLQQQQLKDQQAVTAAWKNYDPSKNKPEDLIKGVLDNGGSGTAANQLSQMLMARQQQVMALDKDAFDLQQKRTDRMLGRFDAAKGVSDDQLADHVSSAIQESVQAGDLKPQEAQQASQVFQQLQGNPKGMRDALDSFEKSHMLGSQIASRAKEAAETQKDVAQAGAETLTAKKTGIEVATPSNDERTTAIGTVNTLTAIPQNQRAAFAKEIQGAVTHAQLQDIQKRADAASESFQRSADARQQALAMKQLGISQLLVGQVNKLDEGLNTTLAGTAGVRQLLDMTKGGNEVASAAAQTRFAEHEIREGGINRMNQAELNSLTSNVGSYGRRIQAWASGGFQGTMPAATNNEMRLILEAEDKQATGLHDKQVETVMSNYGQLTGGRGGKFTPQSTQTGGGGGGKTLSMSAIQQAAQEHGVSIQEARRQAEAQGYTVK